MKKRGIWLALAVSISSFHIGYTQGAFSISAQSVLEYFQDQVHNEVLQLAFLNTLVPFTAAFGSFFGYCCIDRGRRKTVLASHIFVALASVISIIPVFSFLYIGRIINGFFTGYLSLVIPQYCECALISVYEIAPVKWRTLILALHQVMLTFGILLSLLFSLPIIYDKEVDERWWSVVFAIPVASSCAILLIFTFIYSLDSPLSYYLKRDTFNLKRSLAYFFEDHEILAEAERIDDEECKSSSRVRDWKAYSSCYKLRAIFSISGIYLFHSPLVLSSLQQLIGINIIIYYSIQYFREQDSTGYKGTVIARSINFGASLLSLLIIWKLSRRVLLLAGFMVLGICSTLLIILHSIYGIQNAQNNWELSVDMIYIIFFQFSIGPIVWIIIPETLSPQPAAVATAFNWLFNSFVAFTIPYVDGSSSWYIVRGFQTGFCVMGAFWSIFVVKETQNRLRSDILKKHGKGEYSTQVFSPVNDKRGDEQR